MTLDPTGRTPTPPLRFGTEVKAPKGETAVAGTAVSSGRTHCHWLTEAGYPVLHGSSFVMALEYTDGGPRGMAILTYSQSGDPASPHFTDQTERFARKAWRPILFHAADIARDVKRDYTVRAPRPSGARRVGSMR